MLQKMFNSAADPLRLRDPQMPPENQLMFWLDGRAGQQYEIQSSTNLVDWLSAVIISFCGLLIFARPIGDFILAKPSLKILALSFLVTIGVTLFLEGLHQHVPKGYIYLPMGFAIAVELLQMRFERNKQIKNQQRTNS